MKSILIIIFSIIIIFNMNAENSNNYDLYKACEKGDFVKVKILIDQSSDVNFSLNTYDILYKKYTPLHIASEKGFLDIVKILLEHNANINASSYTGNTPVMIAALNKKEDVIRFLIEKNAYLEQQNNNRETLLIIAEDNKLGIDIVEKIKENLNKKNYASEGELFVISEQKLSITVNSRKIGFSNEKIKIKAGAYKIYLENDFYISFLNVSISAGMLSTYKDIKLVKKEDLNDEVLINKEENMKEVGPPVAALVLSILPPTNLLGISFFLNHYFVYALALAPQFILPMLSLFYLDVAATIGLFSAGAYNYFNVPAYKDTGLYLMIGSAVTFSLAYLSNLIITIIFSAGEFNNADFKKTKKMELLEDMIIGMNGENKIILGKRIRF